MTIYVAVHKNRPQFKQSQLIKLKYDFQ